jgi:transcriptional regulator with XRE-family HTH domain
LLAQYGGWMVTTAERASCGTLLRQWRRQRRLSQLELSLASGVSTRHLSCLETGKAAPSRQILLHLAATLDIPLRERNLLLLAAGFAPNYRTGDVTRSDQASALSAFERVLAAHDPYPAIVIDRQWNTVRANGASRRLVALGGGADELRPNALRMALHPRGLAPCIANLEEWSGHLLSRLRRQLTVTADPYLSALYDEVKAYPGVTVDPPELSTSAGDVVVLSIRVDGMEMRLLNTITVFGAPLDTTLADLVLEAFHPADEMTEHVLRRQVGVVATPPAPV